MSKPKSAGKKRLDGLMSDDPGRVTRSFRRTRNVLTMDIHRHMVANLESLRRVCASQVPNQDIKEELGRYVRKLEELAAATEDRATCDCYTFQRNPARFGSKVALLAEHIRPGGSYALWFCTRCGQGWDITEDLGYHWPQYEWTRARE